MQQQQKGQGSEVLTQCSPAGRTHSSLDRQAALLCLRKTKAGGGGAGGGGEAQ